MQNLYKQCGLLSLERKISTILFASTCYFSKYDVTGSVVSIHKRIASIVKP